MCKPVAWRKLEASTWETCASISLAAKQLGVCHDTVVKCCRGLSSVSGVEIQFADVGQTALDGEEWRPMLDPTSFSEVPGRQVSSLGRITSQSGSIYKGSLNGVGYYRTEISRRPHFVHRLVALSFLGRPPRDRPVVNHKDLDKGNNAVENLEYVSMAENMKHYHANAVREGKLINTKPVWSRRLEARAFGLGILPWEVPLLLLFCPPVRCHIALRVDESKAEDMNSAWLTSQTCQRLPLCQARSGVVLTFLNSSWTDKSAWRKCAESLKFIVVWDRNDGLTFNARVEPSHSNLSLHAIIYWGVLHVPKEHWF